MNVKDNTYDIKRTRPEWLKQKSINGTKFYKLKKQLEDLNLTTVCQEAQCPNIGECWNSETGTATIMLLGDECTRGCRFCAVKTSQNPSPINDDESDNTAIAISLWDISYVVLTSVNRDDLVDGGSSHFAKTVKKIKQLRPDIIVECLVPDFKGNYGNIQEIASSGLDVFAHNIETVESLQRKVRDSRANYFQSLKVLDTANSFNIITKSSMMLGLGESSNDIINTMYDLKDIGVQILTLGQYLQPSRKHLPVEQFVHPEEFNKWKKFGEDVIGFNYVASGPFVRSSYKAGEIFVKSLLDKNQICNIGKEF